MAYDYTKDATDNLIDMINGANLSSYTKAHLDFGTPQPNLDPTPVGKTDCNTRVLMVGTAATALTGQVPMHYNRIVLSTVLNPVDFVLDNTLGEYHTVHDLLPWFLEQGYRFTPADIENDLILVLPTPFEQVIRAKPESLAFLDTGKIQITG